MFRRLAFCALLITCGSGCAVTGEVQEAVAVAQAAERESVQARSAAEAARAAADSAAQAAAAAQRTADQALASGRQAQRDGPYGDLLDQLRLERMYLESILQKNRPAEERLVPNSEYVPEDQPFYRVWFGTNRALRNPSSPNNGFSDKDGQKLIYGRAVVYVPQSHKFGETGSSWIVRKLTREDDRLQLQHINLLSKDEFSTAMTYKLMSRLQGKRTALVYIHGYKTKFEEAIIRAAQIGYDLKVEGITAAFSWPSVGSTFGYTADEATIQASEEYLEEFLRTIITTQDVENVNILAHSMGNRALIRVLSNFAKDSSLPNKPINQIILAAPDVDVRIFETLAANYSKLSTRTTLYVSAEDKPLELSGWLHNFQRVGKAPPVSVFPNIDTIAVDEIDISTLGHSYFAEAEALLYDIYSLINTNSSPENRQRLRLSKNEKGQNFWFFGE